MNQVNSQTSLGNSLWMFNTEYATYYHERFEFVKFNGKNKIEYLNEEGNLIRKDTLEIDEDGHFSIKSNPSFHGIEFVNSEEINLIYNVEHFENDISIGRRDTKFNLLKLPITDIAISKEELDFLSNDSSWELKAPNKKLSKHFRILAKEKAIKKEDASADSELLLKNEIRAYLLQTEGALVFIRQSLNHVDGKAIVTKISDEELVMKADGKDRTLKKII